MGESRRVIRLEPDGPPGVGLRELECDPAGFQSPLPKQRGHIYFSDPAIGLTVGVWDTTTMQEAFGPYPGDEFVHIITGDFSMVGADGQAVRVTQGQSACLRNAVPTSWKQDGYLRKFYMTCLDPTAPVPEIDPRAPVVRIVDPEVELTPLESTGSPDSDGSSPKQREHVAFVNDAGTMQAGVWDSRRMESDMAPFPAHELVRMLEGSVTITHEDGSSETFAAGDCFFVPKGTVCSWRVERYVRKVYASLDAG